jgi:hypothetical protein
LSLKLLLRFACLALPFEALPLKGCGSLVPSWKIEEMIGDAPVNGLVGWGDVRVKVIVLHGGAVVLNEQRNSTPLIEIRVSQRAFFGLNPLAIMAAHHHSTEC